MFTLGTQAKAAAALMAKAPADRKNQALRVLAHLLRTQGAALAAHNAQDIERAQAAGLAARSACVTRAASAWLEASASEPPRKMQALPLLIDKLAASIVTFGRLS